MNWFKGSRELVPGKTCNVLLTDSTAELELFEVGPLQTGDYTCLVTNDAGSCSCTTHLFVKGLSQCYSLHLLQRAFVLNTYSTCTRSHMCVAAFDVTHSYKLS